jgi:hypothetical protein
LRFRPPLGASAKKRALQLVHDPGTYQPFALYRLLFLEGQLRFPDCPFQAALTRIEIKEKCDLHGGRRQVLVEWEGQNQREIELTARQFEFIQWRVMAVRILSESSVIRLAKAGKTAGLQRSGMKSPGKVGNNRTLEAVGSTPFGSTNIFKGLNILRPLETLPELPIVRIFV